MARPLIDPGAPKPPYRLSDECLVQLSPASASVVPVSVVPSYTSAPASGQLCARHDPCTVLIVTAVRVKHVHAMRIIRNDSIGRCGYVRGTKTKRTENVLPDLHYTWIRCTRVSLP